MAVPKRHFPSTLQIMKGRFHLRLFCNLIFFQSFIFFPDSAMHSVSYWYMIIQLLTDALVLSTSWFLFFQPSVIIYRENWRIEDDIKSEYPNPETGTIYIFSDGAGRISQKCAKRIAKALEISPVPSCFQVVLIFWRSQFTFTSTIIKRYFYHYCLGSLGTLTCHWH